MPIIRVRHGEMSTVLRSNKKANQEALGKALERVFRRTATLLKNKSPIGATKEYSEGWGTKGYGVGLRLVNTAPYAGIVEKGCRPHPVSAEGIKSITEWVLVKITKDPKEAEKIANAIAWKIRHYGQEGQHILEKQLPKIQKMLEEILKDEMDKARARARR